MVVVGVLKQQRFNKNNHRVFQATMCAFGKKNSVSFEKILTRLSFSKKISRGFAAIQMKEKQEGSVEGAWQLPQNFRNVTNGEM